MIQLIGREAEQQILQATLNSSEAEMLALIGRRRVGKTFLVNSFYNERISFSITGIQNAKLPLQLQNFAYELATRTGEKMQTPSDWMDAFVRLINYLETIQNDEKQVIFFDELPWLASPRSGFLQALSFFWNSWAVKQNIVVVICGSAASWMIQKVINHKGGLYNRVTKRIYLEPFNLYETEQFLKTKHVFLDRYQIIQIYMAMGGIPHHLKEVKAGKSAAQNINDICFSKNGLLRDEFPRLYASLFDDAAQHIAVIKTLASKWQGFTRAEIIQMAHLPNGGSTKRILEELAYSGFITAYRPFGKKKKEMRYRLTDEYSLFYLKFIEDRTLNDQDLWQKWSQTAQFKTWSGYAFESICLKHSFQIKKALGISGIYTESSVFYKKGEDKQQGVQIDLLIDRNDHVINLFEMKFYNATWSFSKADAQKIRQKIATFQELTQTSKQVFMSLVTTFGIQENEHSIGLIQQVLSLDDLFVDLD